MPITAWLLAVGGIVLWEFLTPGTLHFTPYLPAVLALLASSIIHRIPRHGDAVEPCFKMALLVGIAAYWLPSVIFLILPLWGYLIYRNLFSLRAFMATLLGVAAVAIWVAVLNFLHLTHYTFHLAHNVRFWIPTGAVLAAWLIATIARQTLRVR